MLKNGKKVAMVYGGDWGLALKTIIEPFGYEYLTLPKSIDNFRRAEDYFPEEWCFDVKLMYADAIEAVQRGADSVIFVTSGVFNFIGPCRLPYIADYQIEKKLRKFTGNQEVQYIVFKFMPQIAWFSLLAGLKKLGINIYHPANFLKIRRALKLVEYKLKVLYEAKNKMRRVRGREREKGTAFKIYKEFERQVWQSQGLTDTKEAYNQVVQRLSSVPQVDKQVLKIGLVGDLYAIFWEFPIFDLENYICQMFDVEILPTYAVYDWYFSKKWKKDRVVNAKKDKYIKFWAGGSDTVTVRSYIELTDHYKADGIIQLRTFGCMPEEVSSLALQAINKDDQNPPAFMILSFDDHSNSEGIKTRLEAFCNTLIRKKMRN